MTLLTARLLRPGDKSSSSTSSQPRERTEKHWRRQVEGQTRGGETVAFKRSVSCLETNTETRTPRGRQA